jgi:hypothetical protein
MDDTDIVRRIGELAAEEHSLEQSHAGEPLGPEELERMNASARPETVVEHYQQ